MHAKEKNNQKQVYHVGMITAIVDSPDPEPSFVSISGLLVVKFVLEHFWPPGGEIRTQLIEINQNTKNILKNQTAGVFFAFFGVLEIWF